MWERLKQFKRPVVEPRSKQEFADVSKPRLALLLVRRIADGHCLPPFRPACCAFVRPWKSFTSTPRLADPSCSPCAVARSAKASTLPTPRHALSSSPACRTLPSPTPRCVVCRPSRSGPADKPDHRWNGRSLDMYISGAVEAQFPRRADPPHQSREATSRHGTCAMRIGESGAR